MHTLNQQSNCCGLPMATMQAPERISMRLFLVLITIVLVGCDHSRSGGTDGGTSLAGADLISLGYSYCRYGGLALVIGGAIYAVLRWGAAGNPIAAFVAWAGGAIIPEIIAIAGACAIVLGIGFIWLGHYFTWVVGSTVVALLAWGWYRRKCIANWIRHWMGAVKKDVVK